MSQDLIRTNNAGLAVVDPEAEALVREQFGLQKASAHEIQYFFSVAKTTGLDPLRKQIYAIMRYDGRIKREKLTIQVGIDGYRGVAARTGLYAGSDDAIFDGTTTDGFPAKATVAVYKNVGGIRCAFTASARWNEYVQTGKTGQPIGQWPKMPHVMLAKCAEALALRKAFPDELGGTHTTDEMQQAESYPPLAADVAARILDDADLVTDDQVSTLTALAKRMRPDVDADTLARSFAQRLAEDYPGLVTAALTKLVQDALVDESDAESIHTAALASPVDLDVILGILSTETKDAA